MPSSHKIQDTASERTRHANQQHRLDTRTGYLGSEYHLESTGSPYVCGGLMKSRFYIQLVLGV